MVSAVFFDGKKSEIEMDSSIWREEIGNRHGLLDLAGRNRHRRGGSGSAAAAILLTYLESTSAFLDIGILIFIRTTQSYHHYPFL
jgi:hypothetical protein